ncbi:S8 family serine peptidase [Adhaeribacter aquaticus]|uniref:S8 family serine peptidase n=1 Tax=Adhaeribacter aquaticus TaxID=299567 RepID=UPI000428BCFE|nr:S8 family serine peptidase [Adhaeribacter aquaticus]
MKNLFFLFLLFYLIVPAVAQQPGSGARKHLIYFKDKENTPFSTSQPEKYLSGRAIARRQKQNITLTKRDFPVNPTYVAGLKNSGAEIWYTSKWFNAAVVYCDSTILARLTKLPFVRSGKTLSRKATVPRPGNSNGAKISENVRLRTTLDRKDYGLAFNQANMIGAVDLHNKGYHGENMFVAVFDGGFPGVDQQPAFAHLFQENRLKGTFDFVDKDKNVFEKDNHGTNVLSTMAAYQPGTFIGTGFKANYFLFITEDSQGEQQIEEINWLLAAEYADSVGVDVINSSLGYDDFDAPSVDYTYQDMNGRNALITRAADYAASTGMLVVNSAGNEGNKPWRYISAPADADSILTVGAVDSLGRLASFSSVGPTFDGRIKPNLVAQGIFSAVLTRTGAVSRSHGTSFASPILAGMAVCFWQANPHLTNMQVIDYLQRSASKAANPDNLFGYGIPNGTKALGLVNENNENIILFPNPVPGQKINFKLTPAFFEKQVTVTVFNMIAQKVLSKTFLPRKNEVISLDISTLYPGLYGCRISGNSANQTLKFLRL